MAKTVLTKMVEKALWQSTDKMGTFGCFEVMIGWFGNELVDFITYDTAGEFKCYEIKTSKADFNSRARLSFVGDFNYYVMPIQLYGELNRDPLFETRLKNNGIGLIVVQDRGTVTSKIKAKRKKVHLNKRVVLLESMVRSMNREVNKFYKINPLWIGESE